MIVCHPPLDIHPQVARYVLTSSIGTNQIPHDIIINQSHRSVHPDIFYRNNQIPHDIIMNQSHRSVRADIFLWHDYLVGSDKHGETENFEGGSSSRRSAGRVPPVTIHITSSLSNQVLYFNLWNIYSNKAIISIISLFRKPVNFSIISIFEILIQKKTIISIFWRTRIFQ